MASLYSLYRQREPGLLTDTVYWKATRDAEYLVKRLKKTKVLGGHNGCVNTVAWNCTGTRLISGSDDCHLNIYDAETGLLRTSAHTSHRANIFCAKFLSSPDDCKAVSCAGIGSVEYTELTPTGDYIGHTFKCQASITYQVATSPCDGNEFLTCEERGLVRLFDLRVKSSCHCNGCLKDVLYSFPSAVTCMAVHPLSPHYVACGLGDGSVGLMDRRMAGVSHDALPVLSPLELTSKSTSRKYRASSLGSRSYKITSVQFNSVGSELLANYSEDYLYLFNSGLFGCGGGTGAISKPTYASQCEWYPGGGKRRRCDSVKRKPVGASVASRSREVIPPTSSSTDRGPPVKKLRLRGDWSDTGPEARPEAQSTHEGSSLMNRMSRMFAQWIDMSLDPSHQDPSHQGRGRTEMGRGQRGRGSSQRQRGEQRQSERGHQSRDASPSSSESSFQLFNDSDNENVNENSTTSAPHRCSPPETHTSDTAVGSGTWSGDPPSTSNTAVGHGTLSGDPPSTSDPSGTWSGDPPSTSAASTESQNTAARELESHQRLLEPAMMEDSSINAPRSSELPLSANASSEDSQTGQNTALHKNSSTIRADPIQQVEGCHSQRNTDSLVSTTDGENDVAMAVEHRTVSFQLPAVHIVEGETDSDDLKSCDEQSGSRDQSQEPDDPDPKSHDRGQRSNSVEEEQEMEGEDSECSDCLQPFMVYKGHRNARTMIKQANFWGDNWVMSGSDCGRVFVWNKWSGEVVNLLVADTHVVNCVQPHPEAYVIATSGIDYNIKLWEPLADELCTLHDLDEVVRRNEVMLQESRNTITVPSTFVIRILAYLNRRRRLQREHQPHSDDSDSN